MSIIRLSHTQKELFLVSPRAWFYKYKLNLKEKIMGSPLFFGTNVEVGINQLLDGKSLDAAYDAFEKAMKTTNLNGKTVQLATSPLIRYSKADFQEHLFTAKELKDLEGKDYNFKAHQSLLRSGKLMIKEFHNTVLPHVKKVIKLQEYVKIENDAQDEIMGFADLICEWDDDRLLVLDIKTSANPYKADCIHTEEKGTQTALYYEALKNKHNLDAVGFLILEKKIRKGTSKKDPWTKAQIIIDKPDDQIIETMYEQYDEVITKIKEGNFPCCSPKCDQYGQQCAYKKYCQSGGTDLTGLVKYSGSKG